MTYDFVACPPVVLNVAQAGPQQSYGTISNLVTCRADVAPDKI